MKNQITLNLLKCTLGIVMFLNFSSCNDELELNEVDSQLIQENSTIEEASSKSTSAKGPKEISVDSFREGASDCATECIELGEESGATSTTQAYNPSKNVTILISNTATDVIFRFSSEESIHYITIDGEQKFCSADDNGGNEIDQETYSISIPIGDFDVDWFGCDLVSFDLEIYRNNCVGNGSGNNATFTATHNLVPVCVCDDENLNIAATNENLDLVFTYNAASALTNAFVEFTFPQILNFELNTYEKYVAPDGKEYSVNNTTNQTVFTWVGDIDCKTAEAETFSFSFSPDCGAGNAKDGEATIWTDMKVNGVSVKGGYTNIKYLGCPI